MVNTLRVVLYIAGGKNEMEDSNAGAIFFLCSHELKFLANGKKNFTYNQNTFFARRTL